MGTTSTYVEIMLVRKNSNKIIAHTFYSIKYTLGKSWQKKKLKFDSYETVIEIDVEMELLSIHYITQIVFLQYSITRGPTLRKGSKRRGGFGL